MFYRRIFGMNWMISACLFIAYSWAIGSMIAALCACHPVSYFWNEAIDPQSGWYRYNFYYYYIGNAAANVVTDVLILLIPIPIVWKLHMRTTQKIGVCGVLLLGGLYVLNLISLPRHMLISTLYPVFALQAAFESTISPSLTATQT